MNLNSETRQQVRHSRRLTGSTGDQRPRTARWLTLVLSAAIALLSACTAPDPLSELETAAAAGTLTESGPGAPRIIDLPRATVILPPGWSPGGSAVWPVFVVLHGWSQNGALMARGPVWSGLARHLPAIMVFPVSGTGGGWNEAPDSGDRINLVSILESLKSKAWTKPGSLILFGWSAGSVLASDMVVANRSRDGHPLADRIIMYSGFMGYWLERAIAGNMGTESLMQVPVLLICGRKEGQDDLGRMQKLLETSGFDYQTLFHPDAHSLRDDMVEAAAAWATATR